MQGSSTLHTDSNESVSGVERLKRIAKHGNAQHRTALHSMAKQFNALTALATVLFRGCFNSLNALQSRSEQGKAEQSKAALIY